MDLFEELSRLLQYSGKKVIETSYTADGVTAVVELNGKEYRIFVAPVQEFILIQQDHETYAECAV